MSSLRNSGLMEWVKSAMYTRLLAVNAGVFLVIQSVIIFLNLSGSRGRAQFPLDLWLATSTDWTVVASRPWSVITHMFTHVSFSHFLWNMVWLYFSGQLFERYYGKRKLLAVYLAGGIFGWLILQGITPLTALEPGFAMGASACIMAVFIAAAVHSPEERLMFFGVFPVKLKVLAIIYVLMDYMALRGEINLGGHIAHLAGAAFGFFYAIQIKKGINILKWFEKLLDAIKGLFVGRKKLKTAYKSARQMTDEEYNQTKVRNDNRVDAILDKIARGGYDSLTRDEKDFLFRHSKRN